METVSSESAKLDLNIASAWDSGLVAQLTLTPKLALNGWTVSFDYAGDIVNIWNARVVSRIGDRYVIEGLGYNSQLSTGTTASFGFQGSGADHDITPVSLVGEPVEGAATPDPVPVVSVADAQAGEDDGQIAFTVSLSDVSANDVTVVYQTQAGTAAAGDDFTAATAEILIPAGQTTATINVPLTNDALPESAETFSVVLLSATGAEIADGTATGTILDADIGEPPVATVTDASITEGNPGTGTAASGPLIVDGPLSTSGSQIIDSAGNAVQIRAVNWFGAENAVRAPHGLWQRPMTEMMDQMVEEGFNAIRLPFSLQNILEDQVATAVGGDPSLAGLTTLEIFDRIVAYAEEIGLKIILDAHRITQGDGAEGIWYAGAYDEQDWIEGWELLAGRYGDSPAVIGADLLNEPHLGTWGTGQRNDWAAAAEMAGNAILEIAPDWLILVEGIGSYKGNNYWWGGQLQGVRDRPVELSVDNKLVYSPHDYPASVFNQPWFSDGSNLYDVFREHWGFIVEEGIAPILLGEFGSRLETDADRAWAQAITTYLSGDFDGDGTSDLDPSQVGPSFAWWSWNPNSGDTGGILQDDWVTVRQEAADLLAPLLEAGDDIGGAAALRLMSFEIVLDAPAPDGFSLTYRTEDGTATAGEDYVAASGSVSFAAGATTARVQVEILPDTLSEDDETFALILTDGDGTVITATGTILDDDAGATDPGGDTAETPVLVTVTGGSVTEADPGAMHMHDDGSMHMHDDGHRYITFEVALDRPATREIILSYTTEDGTAVADTTNDVAWDYHTTAGTLVFAPGEQTKRIPVAVHPDMLVEGTETFGFRVSGENLTGTLSATGTIYDNDTADPDDGGAIGGETGGGAGSFVGGGQTYYVGQTAVITDFDPTTDRLDLGSDSIHTQIPVDTPDGLTFLHMFNPGKSTLVQGISLSELSPASFAPIADAHLQQDLSAALAWEDGSGLVRPNTVYVRSHEEGLEEIVDFNPATDKISFFYLSVRGDGQLNFAVEDSAEGARFYSPITGQSLTLRGVSFAELDSTHFEWRANQLEDNVAGRMGLSDVIDDFRIVSENVFSGKSVAMAGLVDRAPYHSQPDYTGTPIAETGGHTGGTDGTDDTGDTDPVDPVVSTAEDGSDSLDAALVVTNDWGSGATVLLRITNVDSIQFTGGWTVDLDLDPGLISNSWNGNLTPRADGSGIIVSDVGWNGTLSPDQSVDVGFQFNQGGLNAALLNNDADFLFL